MRDQRATLSDRFVAWWTRDLPPMHGALRFVFYAGMLVLAWVHWKSPLLGVDLYAETDPAHFRSYGLIRWLGIPHIPVPVVRGIAWITTVAWVSVAVGFCTRLSCFATALGVFFLHGLLLGTNALNHNWFLAMYTLIVLNFARMDDAWSLDSLIRRIRRRPSPPRSLLASSGFARKLVLVFAVGFYFSAGLCKLQNAGWMWLDGETIAYFANERAHWHHLGRLLLDYAWLNPILSVLTIALEVGAPLALLLRRTRLPFLIGWTAMHVGIHLTLGPRYWQNILCFCLLIEWRSLWRRSSLGKSSVHPRSRSLRLGATGGSVLLLLLAFVAVRQVFWWPLTNVYMYSSYYSLKHDIRAGHPQANYEDAHKLQRIARQMLSTPPSQDGKEFLAYRPWLRLARDGFVENLFDGVGVATTKQHALVILQPLVIRDLASKPDGKLAFDPTRRSPAAEFCQSLIPVIQRHLPPKLWAEFARVELVCSIDGEIVVLGAADLPAVGPVSSVGSATDRIDLFERLVRWTLSREAFSQLKSERLGLDFARDAERLRPEFRNAKTEWDLLLALHRLSNLRRDGHLAVSLVPGGLLPGGSGFGRAPIRFAVDYSAKETVLFVRDLDAELDQRLLAADPEGAVPQLGDKLITVNGVTVRKSFQRMQPYLSCSTSDRQRLEFAVGVSTRQADHGPELYEDDVCYGLERNGGEAYTVTLPYLHPTSIRWAGDSVEDVDRPDEEPPHVKVFAGWARKPTYPGFRQSLRRRCFTLHVHKNHPLVLLEWHGFFSDHVTSDVDDLVNHAREKDLLTADVICDMTASRGGRRSWWLLQRLVSKSFRVTYGNLRISDVTAELVRTLELYAEDPNRRWLVSWLQEDVREAIRLGASYSTSVPFKLRALSKSSDGILQPAEVRFTGRLVCLFGPLGQSQVDQFAAMVIDNDLGHSLGMPTGGASNTWEWQQTVRLGNEQAPLVDFMWTIGHTIRPNGQVLEGNPPIPKELVVMTRRNFVKYYEGLLRRAERWLGY